MLMQAYFDFAHSIRALRNAAVLSCGMKKRFLAFECACCVTATEVIHPSYMSTSVIADPGTFIFCLSVIAFWGKLLRHRALEKKKKKDFPISGFLPHLSTVKDF